MHIGRAADGNPGSQYPGTQHPGGEPSGSRPEHPVRAKSAPPRAAPTELPPDAAPADETVTLAQRARREASWHAVVDPNGDRAWALLSFPMDL